MIVRVVGGLILLGIPPFLAWLFGGWGRFFEIVGNLWGIVVYPVQIPAILAAIVCLYFIALVLVTIARSRRPTGLNWRAYTTDLIFGVTWHWQYGQNDQPIRPSPECAKCRTPLIWKEAQYGAAGGSPYCETCNLGFGELHYEPAELEEKVIRQIIRKLRSGEWKQVVEQQRSLA
jgi:hypothetical protein